MRLPLRHLALCLLIMGCGTPSHVATAAPSPDAASPVAVSPSASASPPSSPAPSPTPKSSGPWQRVTNFAYDSTRFQIVLFGGTPGANADTWVWNGKQWSQKNSAANPSTRQGAALTDDPDHHVVILFGGDATGNLRGDTWLWDGSNWTPRSPLHSPSARTGAALTYDRLRHVAVLFGGNAGGQLNDTWTWDGTDWTVASPQTPPRARMYARLAFDGARGNTVLYGGFGGLDDTWTWDGKNWTLQNPGNTPPGILEATPVPQQMVYDAVRKVVVFVDQISHGSLTALNTMETWTWDGTTWTRLPTATSPPLRDGYGLAFDAERGVTVLAGGFGYGNPPDESSTWGWNGINWSQIG